MIHVSPSTIFMVSDELKNFRAQNILMPDIHTIAIVGGLIEDSELAMTDQFHLMTTFKLCAKNGITIDPDPDIEVINRRYRHDFTEDPTPADLVIIGYIMNETQSASPQAQLEEGKRWHDAILRSNPKYIVNVFAACSDLELPTAYFDRPPYRVIDEIPGCNDSIHYALLERAA